VIAMSDDDAERGGRPPHHRAEFAGPHPHRARDPRRAQLRQGRAAPHVHLNASTIEIADHSPAPPPRKPGMAE